jgi:hypothetical protein
MRPEPSNLQKSLVTEAAFLRGQIIGSYAQVEFLLADLAVRCSVRPEYHEHLRKFPYKLESRLKAVRQLAELPGPIHFYRDELVPLIDQILKYEELRHFMAHGLLVIKTQGPNHLLQFRLYDTKDKGQLALGIIETTCEQLLGSGTEVAEFASSIAQLFKRIYLEQKLQEQ